MKFILATSKKEVLKFLKKENWKLYESPTIEEWEDCTEVTLIGYKGILCEAYLRVVKD